MDRAPGFEDSRRHFVAGLTASAAAAGLGLQAGPARAQPPPETKRLRLAQAPAICIAPQYLAEEFLPAEGFTDVQYLRMEGSLFTRAVVAGEVDIVLNFSGPLLTRIDVGDPIVVLAGVHVGCFELFTTQRVRAVRDLKGKTVGISEFGGPDHVFLSSIMAYVGLNPQRDVHWVTHPFAESTELLAAAKIDAVLAFPPQPQELRARKIGHVIVNSMMDRPWAQYFCCMAYANREFVREYPVATKRVLRAFLRAADVCAREPERVARFLVEKGYTDNYGYALETMRDVVYGRWRQYDAEDTVRFYALRLHEAGMIRSNPKKIIADGTNWRFLSELKRELKG